MTEVFGTARPRFEGLVAVVVHAPALDPLASVKTLASIAPF